MRVVIERFEFKTIPPFAVLKKALDEQGGVSEDAMETQALAEWGKLWAAIARFGPDRKPQFHPTTDYALRLMGGWENACEWTTNELEFRRKDFLAFWKQSHGRVEQMELGAAGVAMALEEGVPRRTVREDDGGPSPMPIRVLLHNFQPIARQ